MNGQKVPAFKGPWHNYGAKKLAKAAASNEPQRPRLLTTLASCGHEVTLKTERYSEKGVRELVLALSKKPCGCCAESWTADERLADALYYDQIADQRRRGMDGYNPPVVVPDKPATRRRRKV